MTDDVTGEVEKAYEALEDKNTDTGPSPDEDWSAGIPGAGHAPSAGGAPGADDGSGAIMGGLDLDVPGVEPMPTAADMNSTNAGNAAAREQAIKDGMDEGTAAIVYPDFSNPEDMLKEN